MLAKEELAPHWIDCTGLVYSLAPRSCSTRPTNTKTLNLFRLLIDMRVAVIGAGVSGAVCAHALRASSHTVTLFDMGKRGPGTQEPLKHGQISSSTIALG